MILVRAHVHGVVDDAGVAVQIEWNRLVDVAVIAYVLVSGASAKTLQPGSNETLGLIAAAFTNRLSLALATAHGPPSLRTRDRTGAVVLAFNATGVAGFHMVGVLCR